MIRMPEPKDEKTAALRRAIAAELERDPDIKAAAAHRAINPPLGYIAFTRHFNVVRAQVRAGQGPTVDPDAGVITLEGMVLSAQERAAEYNRGYADCFLALAGRLQGEPPVMMRATGTDGMQRLTLEDR